MNSFLLRTVLAVALVVVSAVAAPAAFAQEHGEEEAHGSSEGAGTSFIGGPDWDAVDEVTIWSLVSIAGGCAVLGVFYLFKRKVGGFPENPSWIAPITIMPASQLPGDDDSGHEAHEGHAPAH